MQSFPRGGPTDLLAEQQKLSSEARSRNTAKAKMGYPLFPGADNPPPLTHRLIASWKEIEKAKLGDTNLVIFAIVGCVDYSFTFGDPTAHHQTGFIYTLGRFNHKTGGFAGAFEAGEVTPQSELRLTSDPLGSHYAT